MMAAAPGLRAEFDTKMRDADGNLGLTLLEQLRDEEGIRELQAFVRRAGSLPEAAGAKKYIENRRRVRETYAPAFSFTTPIEHDGIIRYRRQGWNPRVDGEIDGETRSLIKRARAQQ